MESRFPGRRVTTLPRRTEPHYDPRHRVRGRLRRERPRRRLLEHEHDVRRVRLDDRRRAAEVRRADTPPSPLIVVGKLDVRTLLGGPGAAEAASNPTVHAGRIYAFAEGNGSGAGLHVYPPTCAAGGAACTPVWKGGGDARVVRHGARARGRRRHSPRCGPGTRPATCGRRTTSGFVPPAAAVAARARALRPRSSRRRRAPAARAFGAPLRVVANLTSSTRGVQILDLPAGLLPAPVARPRIEDLP